MKSFIKVFLNTFTWHFVLFFWIWFIFFQIEQCPPHATEGTPERALCEMSILSSSVFSLIISLVISLVISLLISLFIFFRNNNFRFRLVDMFHLALFYCILVLLAYLLNSKPAESINSGDFSYSGYLYFLFLIGFLEVCFLEAKFRLASILKKD